MTCSKNSNVADGKEKFPSLTLVTTPIVTTSLVRPRLRIVLIAIVGLLSVAWNVTVLAQSMLPVPSLYHNDEVFRSAIANERPGQVLRAPVTGIGVPHHLLAADLIARGFWAASSNTYQRIIIVSPDHFNRSRRPFAISRRDFATPFGVLENDRVVSEALLGDRVLFDESDLFEREHGIQALLPFISHFFPNAKIIPIAASYTSTRADWDQAVLRLKEFVDSQTLIVQSTDYSHYLPLESAVHRDQETLNVLAAGDLDALNGLVQPDHLDSKAAQYIQMRLQAESFSAGATVVANRDSSDYGSLANNVTTYIVTVYSPQTEVGSLLRYSDQKSVYFGGDTFVGRWFTLPLADPGIADKIIEKIRSITVDAPLIVNLEGIPLRDPPPGVAKNLHVMDAALTIRILRSLNVRAVSLANNHSHDLGDAGFEEGMSVLKRAKIDPLRHMRPVELERIGLVAINFIGVRDYKGYPVIKSDAQLQALCESRARSPLVAFVHWGDEYRRNINPAQYSAADALHRCGVSVIVGAHSHRASPKIEAPRGGEYLMIGSLGNLLFDQRGGRVSGALLELRSFAKGTVASRLIPIPNLYQLAFEHMAPNPWGIRDPILIETEPNARW